MTLPDAGYLEPQCGAGFLVDHEEPRSRIYAGVHPFSMEGYLSNETHSRFCFNQIEKATKKAEPQTAAPAFTNTCVMRPIAFLLFPRYAWSMYAERFDRITRNPAVMGGKPCIRGTRVTAGRIVSQIGEGETIEELLEDYPYIERQDIMQAIQYAAWLAQGYETALVPAHA